MEESHGSRGRGVHCDLIWVELAGYKQYEGYDEETCMKNIMIGGLGMHGLGGKGNRFSAL